MRSKPPAIEFVVRAASPEAHLFGITMKISKPAKAGQILRLPAWIPGSYMIRDFARNIVRLNASSAGKTVKVSKIDKQTWLCSSCGDPIEIDYEVYAWDLSVRAAHLDTTHAYFNGPSMFLAADGFENERHFMELIRPAGDAYKAWRVATSMTPATAEPFGFGTYEAKNYHELIDHPVEMGTFVVASFPVSGISHDIVLTGHHRADLGRLQKDLTRVCEQHAGLFGDLPVTRYLFLVTAVGDGYGGLEHRSSCSLLCARDDLPRAGMESASNEYRRFLGLCSHEYFHLWNVKRIRPAVFTDENLRSEVYTELLWAFEGITSYYDDLALVRSGCIDEKSYLDSLAKTVTRVLRGTGRLKQTLAESSFDAWIKFYKQDENAPNAIVSYYTKGALVALTLDLTIRKGTDGVKSLDDLMQALWKRYGRSARGVPEDGVETLAAEVTGMDLKGFFDRALRDTVDLPLEGLLAYFGVGMQLRPAVGESDQGGVRSETEERQPVSPVLGARIAPGSGDVRLAQVFDDGAAQRAGLAAGDVLVAVDGIKATSENVDKLFAQIPARETGVVHVFRRDELMTFEVEPLPPPDDTCDLWLVEDPSASMLDRRRSWLTGHA